MLKYQTWSHHQSHGQAFESLERINVSRIGDERVAEEPGGVGQHPDDDDVHVTDDVSDRTGEDEEGEARHHPDGHSPAHQKVGRAQIVEVPEEESFDKSPECSGKHHHAEKYENFGILQDGSDIAQNSFSGRFKVQLNHHDHDSGDDFQAEVDVDDSRVGRLLNDDSLLVVDAGRGSVNDVSAERSKNDCAKVSDESLDSVISSHLLNGGHDCPLEHHQRRGRQNPEHCPDNQVSPEGQRRIVDDAGVGVVAQRTSRKVDEAMESAAWKSSVDQWTTNVSIDGLMSFAERAGVDSRDDLRDHFLGAAVDRGDDRQPSFWRNDRHDVKARTDIWRS